MDSLIAMALVAGAPHAASGAAPQAAAAMAGGGAAMPPVQAASAADIAAHISPRDIAAHMPVPQPTTELVAVTHDFFNLLENITVVAIFVVGFFLLARLIHAWMLHRSIRRALEAKADGVVVPLIDKLNKPYEPVGTPGEEARGDDRNALVLIAIGLAMAGFGLIQGQEQLIRVSAGAALFPAFVGIALLVRRRLAAGERDAA